MVRWILCITLAWCAVTARAQDLSDIVNRYTNLRSYVSTGCQATLRVGSSAGFTTGDRILIIQMKGAGADLNDSPSFGRLTSIGNAGRFQFATVASTTVDEITILEPVIHPFDVNGAVQVIKVASGTDLRVVAPVRALPWDGVVGGVVVIEATRSLTLRAPIDADGAGFFGGTVSTGSTTCNVTTLVAPDGSSEHARRGSGIVDVPTTQSKGRGFVVNAGGGGNGSNAGGGGGSSAGTGGRGGDQWVGCGRGLNNGGLGGQSMPIDISNVRLFLGGGGGAGHQNNNLATEGASGGGIVIIKAPRIDGQGQSISALGADVNSIAGYDGAGGGGGGGMIFIDAATMTNVALQAYGGAGGSIRFTDAHGPGGGGGGGAILTTMASLPGTVSTSIWGGPHGVNLMLTVPADRPFGASDGSDGVVFTGVLYGQAVPGSPIVNSMTRSITACSDTLVTLTATASGGTAPYRYDWFEVNGASIGTGRTISAQVRPPSKVRLRITDARGCTFDDSVLIINGPSPRVFIPDVDLGLRPACDVTYNTTVDAVVATPGDITLKNITVSDPAVSIISPAIGSTFAPPYRLSIRYSKGTSGKAIVSVVLRGPCDTTVTFTVTWKVDSSGASITPTLFDLGSIEVCDTTQDLSPITITYRGRPATLTAVIDEGSIRSSITVPQNLTDGKQLTVLRNWIGLGAHQGRLGFVITESSCIDTLWVDVVDTVTLFNASVTPATIDLGNLVICDSSSAPSTFSVAYVGSSATLVQILQQGTIQPQTAAPQALTDGQNITFDLPWRGYGSHNGRVGLIVTNGNCTDTLWIDISQQITKPVFSTSPLDLGEFIACRDSIASMSSVIRSTDPTVTLTIVDVTTSSPALSTSLSGGMQITPGTGFLVSLTTPPPGPFLGTISIRVLPCDTVLTIDVVANVVDASISTIPSITYATTVIGGTETQRLWIVNNGTADVEISRISGPQAPFTITGVQRNLPTILNVNDSMWVDVECRSQPGVWLDSIVIHSDDPCVISSTTMLRSDVPSVTKLWMPRVVTEIGKETFMPIILEERPGLPKDPAPEFETVVRVPAKNVQFVDLTNTTTGTATVTRDEDDVVIQIRDRWNGTDTIATMILMPLLSREDSVDVLFDTTMPIQWVGVPSSVEYRHGRLVFADVCASNKLRSIQFGGAITAIQIAPHPVSEVLNVDVMFTAPEPYTLSVIDLQGTTVLREEHDASATSKIDVHRLSSGMYGLVITTTYETRTVPFTIVR